MLTLELWSISKLSYIDAHGWSLILRIDEASCCLATALPFCLEVPVVRDNVADNLISVSNYISSIS
jgi:hypothetical protein